MSGRSEELFELLDRGGVVLGDGAMGTLLQARGIEPGGAAELWNVDHADTITAVHTEYAEAGARLVTTNTFGGTSARLALHGLEDRVRELNLAGARIAREVADRFDGWVLGDVGPSGELLAPIGLVEPDEIKAMFAEQIAALAEGGADVILVETMSDLAEVEAAVGAAAEVAPELPVAATLTFDTHGHTMMGVSPERAAEALASLGARIVGGNCGNGPHEIGPVMTQMAQSPPLGRPPDRAEQRRHATAPRLGVPLRRHPGGHGRVRRADARAGRRRDRGLLRLDACARGRDARRARPRPDRHLKHCCLMPMFHAAGSG